MGEVEPRSVEAVGKKLEARGGGGEPGSTGEEGEAREALGEKEVQGRLGLAVCVGGEGGEREMAR